MKVSASDRMTSQITAHKTKSLNILILPFLVVILIMITAACTSLTKPQEINIWKDTFDENSGWQLSADASATVSIQDGKMLIEVHTPGQVAWSAHESIWDNFHMTIVSEQIAGPLDNEYGICVRMDDDNRFYILSISGDGYVRAALFQDDVWTVLGSDWTPSEHINQGLSTNTLSVTAQDTSLALSVNNEEVLRIEDETLTKGSIGLYAGAFGEGGVVIAFDELDVSALP